MQSSILIEERGIIKAGLILLCRNHNTHRSCRRGWMILFSHCWEGFLFYFLPLFSYSTLPLPLILLLVIIFFSHFPSVLHFSSLHAASLTHLPSVSPDISHNPSPACPWGQIGEVVKNPLNLTVWHYTVNLWVDRRCPTVLSVTAQEADGCLGRKPSDTIAPAAPQSDFYSQTCSCQIGFIGKGNVYHWA